MMIEFRIRDTEMDKDSCRLRDAGTSHLHSFGRHDISQFCESHLGGARILTNPMGWLETVESYEEVKARLTAEEQP